MLCRNRLENIVRDKIYITLQDAKLKEKELFFFFYIFNFHFMLYYKFFLFSNIISFIIILPLLLLPVFILLFFSDNFDFRLNLTLFYKISLGEV